MDKFRLNLQHFADEGAVAGGGESAGAQTADTVSQGTGTVQAGDALPDGTKVGSARVAAAMERQMQRHPELRKVYGREPAGQAAQATVKPAPAQVPGNVRKADAQGAQAQAGEPQADDVQARWEAAKKGEFAQLYGQDVQKAVQDRFRNQQNLQEKLEKLEPALKVLRERAGVESNEDLVKKIMDDDSIYEDAANEMGMTVSAYKDYLQLKQEHDQIVRAQEEQQFQEGVQRHYQKLAAQAEAMREQFPDINLDNELRNPTFMRLTAPDIGMSVEDAYFAVHHKDLAPQMMAYGMQRARNQMAQSIMANQQRPKEGALKSQQSAAADVKIDPRGMTRKERDALRNRIHGGLRGVTFD